MKTKRFCATLYLFENSAVCKESIIGLFPACDYTGWRIKSVTCNRLYVDDASRQFERCVQVFNMTAIIQTRLNRLSETV